MSEVFAFFAGVLHLYSGRKKNIYHQAQREEGQGKEGRGGEEGEWEGRPLAQVKLKLEDSSRIRFSRFIFLSFILRF